MNIAHTLLTRLASALVIVMMVFAMPAPAFVAYAEESAPAESPVPEVVETPAPPSDGEPAIIETGDAESVATADAVSNTTDVTLGEAPATDTPADTPPTETDDVTPPEDTPTTEEVPVEIASTTAQVASTTEEVVDIANGLTASTTAMADAETGENAVLDGDGGIIDTGNANAFSWIFSLFNVAIINSTGAIHFYRNPVGSALNFTQQFVDAFSTIAHDGACSLVGCGELGGTVLKVFDESVATVENVSIARSGTGGNSCLGGVCGIATGNANAMAGITNIGNMTLVDARYLLLFMANEGDLHGDISVPDASFFSQLTTGAQVGPGTALEVESDATIENTAAANADTGENTSVSEEGSEIETGNANAGASSVNVVNQLGAPICFVIAVGGEWRGSVYAMPVGFSQADAPFGSIICGSGAGARDPVTGLQLQVKNYAHILNTAIAEAVTGNNEAEGLVSKIKTGDANAFAQILNLVDMTLIGQDWVFANFAVSGDWDGDLVFGVKPGQYDFRAERSVPPANVWYYGLPKFTITKFAEVEEISSPANVTYTIVVTNEGGTSGDAVVSDILTGPDGETIGEQQWDLGPVSEGEEVTITYTIEFNGEVTPGYYTNTATLKGTTSSGGDLDPMTAQDVIEILPSGEVLGESMCAPVLTEYIRPGRANNQSQVRALQSFLNTFEGAALDEDGVYRGDTVAAVHAFQKKYAADILTPWGIVGSTGNVYYTTQKKVNEIACDQGEFPLTAAQMAEIEAFKKAPATVQETIIETGNTGLVPRNLLQFPFFGGDVFKTDASVGVPASTSALFKKKLETMPVWAMFAPFVDALEL